MRKACFAGWCILVASLLITACSPISETYRNRIETEVPFRTLAEDPEKYAGDTVVLGGYVLTLQAEPGETLVTVQQAPLSTKGEPREGVSSEGVFIVSIKGERYRDLRGPGQRVTVAGTVAGVSREDTQYCSAGCLKLEALEAYVWPGASAIDYRLWPRYPYDKGARSWEGL